MDKLTRGCVVMMKSSSGLVGYGNEQCVSGVCEPLGNLSLFGHNQHYNIYDVAKIVERPECRAATDTWIFNQGYQQGHHDTVEGMFTDVLPEDSSEYHDDIVKELLADYAATEQGESDVSE